MNTINHHGIQLSMPIFKMSNFKQSQQIPGVKLDALRENKPSPNAAIRISDFGLPDPKRDPDRHQNCITWSLTHALPL